MMYLCVWDQGRRIDPVVSTLHTALLAIVPRIALQGDLLWADLRSLPVQQTLDQVRHTLQAQGATAPRFGIATTPIAAEVAARYGTDVVTSVPAGDERDFLARFPVMVLDPEPALARLLDGTGIETCEELARLTREAVEVRFGAAGARLWRRARADDPRQLFAPPPRGLPEASLEWTDYTLRRAERLLFVINALCGNVCEALQQRGEGALQLGLRFSLANRTIYEHPLRVAHATSRHVVWMRLVRHTLEHIVLPDAVVGLAVRVEHTVALGSQQGNLFDRGFSTRQMAEDALEVLLEDQAASVVEPDSTAHPLIERRTAWNPIPAPRAVARSESMLAGTGSDPSSDPSPVLTLQVLPEPMRVTVATVPRQGREVPRSYRDAQLTHTLVEVAGPDQVSGGQWDTPYAREYYRAVTTDGVLVWLYREVRTGIWYLHGWWD